MTTEERAYDFSVRMAECVRFLKEDSKNFPLCGKLLECGLDAGLAVRGGRTNEAAEIIIQADYILEMAARSGYMTEAQTAHLRADAQKLLNELR